MLFFLGRDLGYFFFLGQVLVFFLLSWPFSFFSFFLIAFLVESVFYFCFTFLFSLINFHLRVSPNPCKINCCGNPLGISFVLLSEIVTGCPIILARLAVISHMKQLGKENGTPCILGKRCVILFQTDLLAITYLVKKHTIVTSFWGPWFK